VARKGRTVNALDPQNPLHQKQIKASIVDAIAKEVIGSSRDEIAQKVEAEYERLLIGASIFAHIPSLTAGLVRRGPPSP
jgi:hypothetical protein